VAAAIGPEVREAVLIESELDHGGLP